MLFKALPLAAALLISLPVIAQKEDPSLDATLQSIAAAHHGKVALYAENLRTHQVASITPDLPVQTASTIKLAILLDAAEQIRAGKASFDEKLVLSHENQVPGSGIIGQLDTPLPLTLRDVLHLMVTLSDNTATNMAIDRLGLDHINQTILAAGLHQTWLYKKVYKPASGPMPADQPKFGLGKTTPREMAEIMTRLVTCNLAPLATQETFHVVMPDSASIDGPICGTILKMLRVQQDRDGLPRYIESLDTSEQGTAIGNKTGALDRVRADVAIIASKSGPIVIAAYTFENQDQRWTGDNEGKITLAKIGEAIVKAWSPTGLDPTVVHWDNPLAPPQK
ncbi:serine hydrolase [Terracidiphilus gabretensis]|uniref:serine hydrolase n=1 Tax=Terracidiphilus gabretensis TaxID=1577687 RepID=UPI00071B9173|nr:serine hydrolase [Terracidiphilus gabretensis]